jgi:hypothetical protein
VSDRIIELLKPFLSWDLRLVDVDHWCPNAVW